MSFFINSVWHLLEMFFTIVEKIMEISSTTGVMVDPVYNIKAVTGLLSEMKNNPSRFNGRRILYIHTGRQNYPSLCYRGIAQSQLFLWEEWL